MDSNQLTLGQIKELSKLIAPAPAASDPAEVERDLGPQIVVLRHGYVYKGYAYIKDGFIYISVAPIRVFAIKFVNGNRRLKAKVDSDAEYSVTHNPLRFRSRDHQKSHRQD